MLFGALSCTGCSHRSGICCTLGLLLLGALGCTGCSHRSGICCTLGQLLLGALGGTGCSHRSGICCTLGQLLLWGLKRTGALAPHPCFLTCPSGSVHGIPVYSWWGRTAYSRYLGLWPKTCITRATGSIWLCSQHAIHAAHEKEPHTHTTETTHLWPYIHVGVRGDASKRNTQQPGRKGS